ncbi:MAG: hypothetical protein ACRDZ7_02650 [Acidimicrobiia bacterium]
MRRWFLCPVVTLLAVLVSPAAIAAESQTEPAPVMAAGRLLDSDGSPMVGEVELFAWPTGQAVEVGQTIELVPVGRVQTTSDGTFAVRSDATPELASLAQINGGYVNLELRALAGRLVQETHLSRYLTEAPAQAFSARRGAHDRGVAWQAAPDEAPAPVTLRFDPPSNGARTLAANGAMPMQGGCWGMKVVDSQIGRTVIGELRAPPDTKTASFVYGKRADSEISIAARAANGPWSVSGSHHIANAQGSAVTQWAESGEHLLVRSRFVYDKYEYFCPSGRREKVVPREWFGDVQPQPTSPVGCALAPQSRVGHYGAKTGFDREQERAVRWEGAADVFGVALSARSGYSQYVQAHWIFGRDADHLLCGDDGKPATSSRIFAGPST